MTAHLLALICAQSAPPEVEYVCSSLAWAVLWFSLGWLTCYAMIRLTRGRK